MLSNRILALDVSFTGTGVAVMERTHGKVMPVYVDILKTKREAKKRHIYVVDDDVRRVQEITESLVKIIEEWEVSAVVAETTTSGAKSASAMKGMTIAMVIPTVLSKSLGLPFFTVQPIHSKKHMTGKKTASKEDMMNAVSQRFPGRFDDWKSKRSKSGWSNDFEDIADAISAYFTASSSNPALQVMMNT